MFWDASLPQPLIAAEWETEWTEIMDSNSSLWKSLMKPESLFVLFLVEHRALCHQVIPTAAEFSPLFYMWQEQRSFAIPMFGTICMHMHKLWLWCNFPVLEGVRESQSDAATWCSLSLSMERNRVTQRLWTSEGGGINIYNSKFHWFYMTNVGAQYPLCDLFPALLFLWFLTSNLKICWWLTLAHWQECQLMCTVFFK